MSKRQRILGMMILKNIIRSRMTDNLPIGICQSCIDDKVDKPYQWVNAHTSYLGVTEVRLPLRENYKYYNHGLCDRHYKKK